MFIGKELEGGRYREVYRAPDISEELRWEICNSINYLMHEASPPLIHPDSSYDVVKDIKGRTRVLIWMGQEGNAPNVASVDYKEILTAVQGLRGIIAGK